jgi:dienelactone hydrolase
MPLLLVSLDDVRAAVDYVKTAVPRAKKDAIAVAGHSYGGMVTLLSAARVNGFKAAVAISAGCLSWQSNPWLQKVLKETAAEVKIPTLLIQSQKECSGSDPTHALKPLLPHNGSDGVLYSYDVGQCKKTHGEFLSGSGRALWRNDVRAFLVAHGVAP